MFYHPVLRSCQFSCFTCPRLIPPPVSSSSWSHLLLLPLSVDPHCLLRCLSFVSLVMVLLYSVSCLWSLILELNWKRFMFGSSVYSSVYFLGGYQYFAAASAFCFIFVYKLVFLFYFLSFFECAPWVQHTANIPWSKMNYFKDYLSEKDIHASLTTTTEPAVNTPHDEGKLSSTS